MNIEEYVNQKKELQGIIIEIVESDVADDFNKFVNIYDKQKYCENKEELRSLLYLISRISENHHRCELFQTRIEQILLHISQDIKRTFSNREIFYIFNDNKKILLFLVQKSILIIDESLSKYIKNDYSLCFYFYPEIRPFIDDETQHFYESQIEMHNFEENRQEGENESTICKLIRNDSIEDFIIYLNQKNILPTSTIKPSIFETNPYLIDKEPTFIQYAFFYGSIQIIKYLHINKVELNSSLWLYAIHSQNPETIQILQDNNVDFPKEDNASECINEAIKCHHIDIANYFLEINNSEMKDFEVCFHYYNYQFFPTNFKNKSFLNYLCKYDYYELLKIAFNDKKLGFQKSLKYQFDKMHPFNVQSIISNDVDFDYIEREEEEEEEYENDMNKNSLHLAAENNNYSIIEFLMSQPEVNLKSFSFHNCRKLTKCTINSNLKKNY